MPKMKSNRAARKRFKISANGKIKRKKQNKRHILTSKPKKRKRQLKHSALVSKSDAARITEMLQL